MHRRGQLSIVSLARPELLEADRRSPGRVRCERLRTTSGTVIDLSRTGAKLRIMALIAPKTGKRRSLVFESAMGPSAPFPCTIAWARRTGLIHFDIGVRFDDLDDSRRAQLTQIAGVHGMQTMFDRAA